jgi:hypothetical protein
VIGDVPGQLGRLPTDATHLVISAGGNNALGEAHVLEQTVRSMADALELLAGVRERFRATYAAMLDETLRRRLHTAVCTIYEPRFPELPSEESPPRPSPLNDASTREAFTRRLDCLDLRVLCDDDRDFANPIEPSVQGGEKIAST